MDRTGIIRRIDDLGRIVIPKDVRRVMHVVEGDPLEIFPSADGILLKRYDEARPIMQVVQELQSLINDAGSFNHREELLNKLDEITALMKAEQREKGGTV